MSTSCTFEEITLLQQPNKDTLSTPLGSVNASAGVFSHNHLTAIWETTYTTQVEPKSSLLESGTAKLVNSTKIGTFRLLENNRQLDFHLKFRSRCNPVSPDCTARQDVYDVVGEKNIYAVTEMSAATNRSFFFNESREQHPHSLTTTSK